MPFDRTPKGLRPQEEGLPSRFWPRSRAKDVKFVDLQFMECPAHSAVSITLDHVEEDTFREGVRSSTLVST